MSLSRCLKKLGVSQHEAAIYKAVFDDYRNDGIDAKEAARKAVQERHDELMAERESVAKQVVAAGGQMPALPGVTAPTEGGQRMALAKDYQKAGDARKAIAYHGLQTTHAPAKVANDWKIVPKEQAQKIAASNRQSAQQAKESRTPGMANNAMLKRLLHTEGIARSELSDITGDNLRSSKAMPGTFVEGGHGIDYWGAKFVEMGYLLPESQSERGNENMAASPDETRDLIRRVLANKEIHTIGEQADESARQNAIAHSEWVEHEAGRLNVPADDLATAIDPTLTREQNESAFDTGQFLKDEGFDDATSEEIRQLAVARADSQSDFDRDYNTDLETAVRSIAAGYRSGESAGTAEPLQLTGQTNAETLAEERAARDAQAKEAANARAAQEKAKADAAAKDFSLTGSDRAADVGAANGQGGLPLAAANQSQVDRPTTNSKGQPIHVKGVDGFWRWFAGSKTVDDKGRPVVVYHGTAEKFNTFSLKKATQGIIWFTSDKAAIDAGDVGAQGRGRVMELYANVKNPAGWDQYNKKSIGELIRDGYDGVILPDSDGTFTGIAFEPNQLKSATNNKGAFDENKPSILAGSAESLGTRMVGGTAISRARVAQIVNAVRAKSKFPIVMYDGKPSDLHSSLSDDAPGAYWQSKVHIFPQNIASTKDLYRVLAHELVGHASVIEMMGSEYQTVVKQIQTAKKFNPAIRELARAVAQTHGTEMTAFEESSEIIAAATERALDENGNVKPAYAWFKRVLSQVAQWLRSKGITVPFTNAELAGMISRAANRLAGEATATRGEPALAAGKDGLNAGSNNPSILAAAREPTLGSAFGPHAIRDSTGAFTNLKTAAINHVSDVFTNNKMFSTARLGMLSSLATQRQKAFVDPENFGKVHQAVQSYLSSVSTFALRAANLAPDVLKQITSVHDAIKSLGSLAQFKQTKADNAALSKTLNRERDIKHRMTDAEMAAAGLTDHQQAMVHQSHDAMDKSMRDLNAASLARMLNGKGMDTAVNSMIESGDVGPVLDSLKTRIEATNDTALQSIYDIAKERTDRIEQLIREGYVPHIRYGEWAVDVIAPHGERWSFSMFESQRAANAAARAMNERTPGYKITVSKMAKEAPRLFDGVSPDVLELFVDQMAEKGIVDPKESEAYQAFLKNVVANNSAMKRLIHSNDVAGYSEDITRVLASFTTANARMAAILTHGPSITQAIGAIDPKTHAESFDEAVKLRDYILNPTEEFAKLRSFLFMNYLGGSVASAMTNITQPILTTLPRLSEYAGLKTMGYLKDGAAVAISRIFKGGTVASGPLRDAIDRGEKDGVLMPQEMHQLYAEAIKGLGSGVGTRAVMQLMGSFFSVSEQFNRELTFVAAFKSAEKMTPEQIHAAGVVAGEPGVNDAYTFAKMVVEDTQFLYNRGNKPNAARGMLAPIFTFKQFSIQYLELIKRLPPQQRMLALGLLALASGVNGLPFADNLDDLIDTIAQSLGFDGNVKQTKRALAYKAFGKTFGDFVLNGASALPGVPLDVQQRLGMAGIIPGTGMFKPSTSDKWKEVLEWFGAPGSVAHSYGQAIGNVQDGRLDLATLNTMPTFMRNILVAEKMWETGEYRSAAGKKVMDVDKADAIVKALGFQPQDVAQTMRVNKEVQQNEDLVKNTRNAIMGKIVQSIVENDPKGRMAAFAELMEWNKTNPTSMIAINPASIQSAVLNARMSLQQRTIRQASPTIRGGISSQWTQQ